MVETIEAQIQFKFWQYGEPCGIRAHRFGLRTITEDGCYFSEGV